MNTTDESEPRPNPTWFGWRRFSRRVPWLRVVAAVTEDLCWMILLEDKSFGGETCVLGVGRDPNTEKRAR